MIHARRSENFAARYAPQDPWRLRPRRCPSLVSPIPILKSRLATLAPVRRTAAVIYRSLAIRSHAGPLLPWRGLTALLADLFP